MRYRFKEKSGDALLFHDVTATGGPDPRTLHAGLAPQNGENWVLITGERAEA